MGVATALWAALKKEDNYIITHYTTDADWLTKKYNLTYDPYRI
jgi:hypothetical protein